MKYIRAAIRFVLFVVSTLGLYSIWWAGSFFLPNRQSWREWAFYNWARSYVKISGMSVQVIGTPPKPPFFLVINHLGYTDVAAIRYAVKGIFVAKAEIRSWFLAGRIVKDMGNIFIDRQNRRDIPRAGELIIEKLNQGEGVVIFPEGTSTKGEEVLPFNSSFLQFAAKTNLPVSYASISYLTPEGAEPASKAICWWDDTTFVNHIFRHFMLKRFTATINFGEEPVQNPDRKQLASQLREKVTEKFTPVI